MQREVKRKKSDIEIRQATKHNNETIYKEMEKQIQTLTSELNQLKNNHNTGTNFKTENRKSFTTTKPNDTLTVKYFKEHFKEMKMHLHYFQKQNQRLCTKQGSDKQGPKNTMLALTTFEKQFTVETDAETTH